MTDTTNPLRRTGQTRADSYVPTHDQKTIAKGGRRRSCGKCGAHHEYTAGAFKAHPAWGMLGPCCRPKKGAP